MRDPRRLHDDPNYNFCVVGLVLHVCLPATTRLQKAPKKFQKKINWIIFYFPSLKFVCTLKKWTGKRADATTTQNHLLCPPNLDGYKWHTTHQCIQHIVYP